MVFGLQMSFARVGSTVNFNVMEPLYKYVSQYYQGYMCIGVVLLIGKFTESLAQVSITLYRMLKTADCLFHFAYIFV